MIRRRVAPQIVVTGLVDAPRTWAWDELGAFDGGIPDISSEAEGFVGEAIPAAAVLAAAVPRPAASHCTVVSDDGHYRASIPLTELREKGWLAFRLDGAPLPRDRGGPIRVIVPQGRTLCWNVKGVVELRLTAGPEPDSIPANPPH